MAPSINFISAEDVVEINKKMIQVGGGSAGVRDFDLLFASVERPKSSYGGEYLYGDVHTMAAALLHSLINNHPFLDGNKRTAIFAASAFLFANTYTLDLQDQDEVIEFLLDCVNKKLDVETIATWLQKHSAQESKIMRKAR